MSRKKRQSRLSYYQRSASGEYIYTGSYMTYVEEGRSRRRLLTELWCMGAGALVCLLAGGFLPVESFTGCGYVLFPYMLALLASIAVLWQLGELTGGGEPIKTYVYEAAVPRIPRLSMLSVLGAVLCILGQIVRCVMNGGCTIGEILFLLLEAAGAALLLLFRRSIRRAHWRLAGD